MSEGYAFLSAAALDEAELRALTEAMGKQLSTCYATSWWTPVLSEEGGW